MMKYIFLMILCLASTTAYAQSNFMFDMPVDGFTETTAPGLRDNYNDCPNDDCYERTDPYPVRTQSKKPKHKPKNFTVILDGDHWPE